MDASPPTDVYSTTPSTSPVQQIDPGFSGPSDATSALKKRGRGPGKKEAKEKPTVSVRWEEADLTDRLLNLIATTPRWIAVFAQAGPDQARAFTGVPKRDLQREIAQRLFHDDPKYDLEDKRVVEALAVSVKNKLFKVQNLFVECKAELGPFLSGLKDEKEIPTEGEHAANWARIKLKLPQFFLVRDVMAKVPSPSPKEHRPTGTKDKERELPTPIRSGGPSSSSHPDIHPRSHSKKDSISSESFISAGSGPDQDRTNASGSSSMLPGPASPTAHFRYGMSNGTTSYQFTSSLAGPHAGMDTHSDNVSFALRPQPPHVDVQRIREMDHTASSSAPAPAPTQSYSYTPTPHPPPTQPQHGQTRPEQDVHRTPSIPHPATPTHELTRQSRPQTRQKRSRSLSSPSPPRPISPPIDQTLTTIVGLLNERKRRQDEEWTAAKRRKYEERARERVERERERRHEREMMRLRIRLARVEKGDLRLSPGEVEGEEEDGEGEVEEPEPGRVDNTVMYSNTPHAPTSSSTSAVRSRMPSGPEERSY